MKRAITQCITAAAGYLVKGIISLAVLGVFTLLILEWATGCGESYIDSKGRVHLNECMHRTIYTAIKGGMN